MIEFLSNLTAKKLVSRDTLKQMSRILSQRKGKDIRLQSVDEGIEIIIYSLQAIYSEIIKIILVIILAKLLNILIPTLIIMAVFSTLRTLAGGVHMDTFLKCFIMMFVMFLGLGLIVQHIPIYNNILINFSCIFTLFLFGSLLVYKYAPVEDPNKPIKVKDIPRFKILSLGYLAIASILMLIFIKYNIIVQSIILGIILEIWTITPGGIELFMFINNYFSKNRGKK